MEMKTVGDIGMVDGTVYSLFQCPNCKSVAITKWIDGQPKCKNCKGIKCFNK